MSSPWASLARSDVAAMWDVIVGVAIAERRNFGRPEGLFDGFKAVEKWPLKQRVSTVACHYLHL